jgi:thiol-disulfide isomerase/thioredoxin
MPHRITRVVGVGLLLPVVVLGASCGSASSPTRGSSSAPARRAAAALPELRPATAEQVLAEVNRPGSKVVLVNVWATFCPPCREEFPDLVRVYRDYRDRGLKLVLVSADFDDAVPQARRFLQAQGVDFPSFLKTGDDMRFINGLNPDWSGALPATLVYDGSGRLRGFWEGRASFTRFEREVLDVLARPAGPDSMEVPS